jgi:hypothetical protein
VYDSLKLRHQESEVGCGHILINSGKADYIAVEGILAGGTRQIADNDIKTVSVE